MPPNLPLAEYRFVLKAKEPVSLPALADPLWRSVFGLALRRISCSIEQENCHRCPLQEQCDYAVLMHPAARSCKAEGPAKSLREIPSPLVFHSRIRTYSSRIPPQATFAMRLILVGPNQDRLAAIIRAVTEAGRLGLGKKRAKFRLVEVVQTGPQPLSLVIMTNTQLHRTGVSVMPPVPEAPGVVRCTLVAPYLLPGNTRLEDGFGSSRFLMQVVRRVATLQQFYADTPANADFRHLKALAETAEIPASDLTVEPGYSYSGNRKRFIAARGSFILDLRNSPELWPWLWLTRWLHLPKLAGKGFGRYELATVEP